MQYRKLGKTGEEVSVLGFGCMRFQTKNNDPKEIKEDLAIEQIRYSIDKGVNYIDTAYPYHGETSEPLVGKALQDGYREKVKLASKLPSWLIEKREDFDKYMKEQMDKLQTDYIDFYLVHAINKERWENLNKHNLFEFLDQVKKDGRARYIGFSFHDELPLFKEIVDSYDWDFCQIQYNYMDENYQAGKEGLDYAASKDLGVIIMEPLRGGHLAGNIPEDIRSIWEETNEGTSPAGWGLRWVWSHEAVTTVLSGMSDMEQVRDNVDTAKKGHVDNLSADEVDMISRVRDIYRQRMRVPCTNCRYCMPCPAGVNIPECFNRLNIAYMFEDPEFAKTTYKIFTRENGKASLCIECGKCEEVCPQNIAIRESLKEVVHLFEKE